VLTVSVEPGSRERARQIDAEAVVVLTQKVEQRFGTSPGVTEAYVRVVGAPTVVPGWSAVKAVHLRR
jgi:hypothetical protein